MKKLLAIVLMMAVLVCPAFASGEASAQPAANSAVAAEPAAAPAQETAQAPHYVLQVVEPATCTENGVNAYVDSSTGEVLFTYEVAATGHVPSADAPTCTDPVVCLQCGEILQPAIGHSYTYQYDAVQNEDGSFASFGTWKCDNCGDVVDATEGNAVYYYGAAAAPAAEGTGEPASAEAPAAAETPDPHTGAWATIEIIAVIVIVVVGAVLMLSFGKKKNG